MIKTMTKTEQTTAAMIAPILVPSSGGATVARTQKAKPSEVIHTGDTFLATSEKYIRYMWETVDFLIFLIE